MSATALNEKATGPVWTFFAAGDPKGQPRPRAFSRGGLTRMYDPKTAEGWKASVAVESKEAKPSVPLLGPVSVNLEFFFRRPKRLLRKCDPDGRVPHDGKPDLDNLAKAVLDALTQLGWWLDDSQVCEGRWAKWYVARGCTPGVCVEVRMVASE